MIIHRGFQDTKSASPPSVDYPPNRIFNRAHRVRDDVVRDGDVGDEELVAIKIAVLIDITSALEPRCYTD